jgi:hypothetical protein
MALVFYSDVTLRALGTAFSADLGVFVGFAVGFLAARPSGAGVGVEAD